MAGWPDGTETGTIDGMELLLILIVVVAALYFVGKSTRQGRLAGDDVPPGLRAPTTADTVRLAAVHAVASEDVTQFGEQLRSEPLDDVTDEQAQADWQRAFTAYENAKGALDAARTPEDMQWVTRALDDGRFALACVRARREGQPLPTRHGPCFFDQRHGIAVQEASWAPPAGAERDVPACAACATTLADGRDPDTRRVPTANGPQPYYSAGPEFGPWARGWYGAQGTHVLSGMLAGTVLGTMLWAPMGYDLGPDAGGEAGDPSAGGEAGDPSAGGEAGDPSAGGDAGDPGDGGLDGGGFGGGFGGSGFDGDGFDV